MMEMISNGIHIWWEFSSRKKASRKVFMRRETGMPAHSGMLSSHSTQLQVCKNPSLNEGQRFRAAVSNLPSTVPLSQCKQFTLILRIKKNWSPSAQSPFDPKNSLVGPADGSTKLTRDVFFDLPVLNVPRWAGEFCTRGKACTLLILVPALLPEDFNSHTVSFSNKSKTSICNFQLSSHVGRCVNSFLLYLQSI